MYKVYDLKNKKKIVVKGSARECAKYISCDITYIYKAAAHNLTISNRYKVAKA